jgi:hypothetical protein
MIIIFIYYAIIIIIIILRARLKIRPGPPKSQVRHWLGIGGAQAHELGAFIIGEGHVVDSGDLQARKEKRRQKTATLVGLAEAEGSKIEPARRYHESE